MAALLTFARGAVGEDRPRLSDSKGRRLAGQSLRSDKLPFWILSLDGVHDP